jgi:hypothetical protein
MPVHNGLTPLDSLVRDKCKKEACLIQKAVAKTHRATKNSTIVTNNNHAAEEVRIAILNWERCRDAVIKSAKD